MLRLHLTPNNSCGIIIRNQPCNQISSNHSSSIQVLTACVTICTISHAWYSTLPLESPTNSQPLLHKPNVLKVAFLVFQNGHRCLQYLFIVFMASWMPVMPEWNFPFLEVSTNSILFYLYFSPLTFHSPIWTCIFYWEWSQECHFCPRPQAHFVRNICRNWVPSPNMLSL